jgi:hypothetical protein
MDMVIFKKTYVCMVDTAVPNICNDTR